MNPLTCRDFCTTNYYAGQLQHYLPNQCRHPALFMKREDIKAEFYKRVILFAANKMSLLPCMVVEPRNFFITATAALIVGSVGSTLWNLRYPPIADRQSRWRDYFEGTAVLDPTYAKIFIVALAVHALANNVSSLIWPDSMVWYNAIYVGLSVGIITSKMVMHPSSVRQLHIQVTRAEPLLPPDTV